MDYYVVLYHFKNTLLRQASTHFKTSSPKDIKSLVQQGIKIFTPITLQILQITQGFNADSISA